MCIEGRRRQVQTFTPASFSVGTKRREIALSDKFIPRSFGYGEFSRCLVGAEAEVLDGGGGTDFPKGRRQ